MKQLIVIALFFLTGFHCQNLLNVNLLLNDAQMTNNYNLRYEKNPASDGEQKEMRQISEWVGHDKRVLEIGCHTANLGAVLRENGNYIVGIDYNDEAIAIAKTRIQEAYTLNLETEVPRLATLGTFDVIICNQVLEHIRNADEVVDTLKTALNRNGRIIIGLPNILNAKNRFNIAFGQWQYEDLGVMDRTHVRFFSYDSALDFLRNNKLKLEQYYSEWRVNPVREFVDHIPLLCKLRRCMNAQKSRFNFSHNITDVVMLFCCTINDK